jgi:methylase of polypeptide subunit release factors
MFGIKNGFDIVIGNPPYIRQERIKQGKDNFKRDYQTFAGTADIYTYSF